MTKTPTLDSQRSAELLEILQERFNKNTHRHPKFSWSDIRTKLEKNLSKLWSLSEMEDTGGEPDVIAYDKSKDEYTFVDCSSESPKGRRSLCYDRAAWESRKQHKPENNVVDLAQEMGIELLSEEEYFALQQIEKFDSKTSSWLATPASIRALGGAIFGDWRFGRVFIYHNGADSYYSSRGFRGSLKV